MYGMMIFLILVVIRQYSHNSSHFASLFTDVTINSSHFVSLFWIFYSDNKKRALHWKRAPQK